jgi:hypothetical protein
MEAIIFGVIAIGLGIGFWKMFSNSKKRDDHNDNGGWLGTGNGGHSKTGNSGALRLVNLRRASAV